MTSHLLAGMGLGYCAFGIVFAVWMMVKAKDWDR